MGPRLPSGPGVRVGCRGGLPLEDAFDVPLGGFRHEAFPGRVMAPLLELELEDDSGSSVRNLWGLYVVFNYPHKLAVYERLNHA